MNVDVYNKIKELADKYAEELKNQVDLRIEEMKLDDTSHYLLYRVLGVTNEEGNLIDLYQNKGRFLYKYAGAFLEEAAVLCIKHKYAYASKVKIKNTLGIRPKAFEIDCLVDNLAHEIKWRDATKMCIRDSSRSRAAISLAKLVRMSTIVNRMPSIWSLGLICRFTLFTV